MLVAFLGVTTVPARAADPVQRVEINLTIEGGQPHPLVVRRIVESVGTAAERLLVGRDSDLVARQEATLAGVLREVTDRVVTGYRVASVGFQPGPTTLVAIRLQPRFPVMGEVPTVIAMPGIHPDAQPLVRASLSPVIPEIERLPAGLPVDALGWAGPILEQRAIELLEGAAAGFSGTARIEGPPAGRIALSMAAKDSRVVRDLGVRFRSSSIPALLLQGYAPQVVSMAEPLRGLPVVFALANRARLEALISERLAAYPAVRDYAIVARPVVQVAEVTYVTVLAESTLYRGRIEARLNFGSQAPAPDMRAHLGRAFGSLEPFVEFTLIPSNLTWHTAVGMRFEVGTNLAVGLKTQFDAGGSESFVTYRFSPDVQIQGMYTSSTDVFESTLTYRLNDFLSWEAVATSRGIVWLRIVSNL